MSRAEIIARASAPATKPGHWRRCTIFGTETLNMTQPAVARGARRVSRSIPVLPGGTLAGFVVALLAVGIIGIFTYRSLQTREEAVERVTHTLLVIERFEALQSNLKDAETGQRGYLLTGEERYLEPYTNARTSLAGVFKDLRSQVSPTSEAAAPVGRPRTVRQGKKPTNWPRRSRC